MAAIAEEAPGLGVRATCEALGVAPATYYRHQRPQGLPMPSHRTGLFRLRSGRGCWTCSMRRGS